MFGTACVLPAGEAAAPAAAQPAAAAAGGGPSDEAPASAPKESLGGPPADPTGACLLHTFFNISTVHSLTEVSAVS
jgi:hypothetical protein